MRFVSTLLNEVGVAPVQAWVRCVGGYVSSLEPEVCIYPQKELVYPPQICGQLNGHVRAWYVQLTFSREEHPSILREGFFQDEGMRDTERRMTRAL